MSRVKDIQKKVQQSLKESQDKNGCIKSAAHLHAVSMGAVMLAMRRGVNTELAAVAGLLHDLYAYQSGSYDNHAELGAGLAEQILTEMGSFSPEETAIICTAIRNHDDKAVTGAPMDEVLKDADVLHHCLADPTKEIKEHEKARYMRLCEELGLSESLIH